MPLVPLSDLAENRFHLIGQVFADYDRAFSQGALRVEVVYLTRRQALHQLGWWLRLARGRIKEAGK
jgi:hypothetical protein